MDWKPIVFISGRTPRADWFNRLMRACDQSELVECAISDISRPLTPSWYSPEEAKKHSNNTPQMSHGCEYRTSTEMEMSRECLLAATGDGKATDRILRHFKTLAGQEGHDFDENVEYLFDHVLEVAADSYGPDFHHTLAQIFQKK